MIKEGYVEKVIYKNDDNGYAVFTVEGEDGEDIFVGTLHGVSEGIYSTMNLSFHRGDDMDAVMELTYLQNRGAAWGMLEGRQGFFAVLTVLVLIAIVYVIIRTPFTKKYVPVNIAATLLAAGALGNFIDRCMY